MSLAQWRCVADQARDVIEKSKKRKLCTGDTNVLLTTFPNRHNSYRGRWRGTRRGGGGQDYGCTQHDHVLPALHGKVPEPSMPGAHGDARAGLGGPAEGALPSRVGQGACRVENARLGHL